MQPYPTPDPTPRFLTAISVALIATGSVMIGEAGAISISATAAGSLTPPTVTSPNTVTNGDFLIAPNSGSTRQTTIGNGKNETTTWTLDFTGDSNFLSFPTSEPLTSALLTLEVTPFNGNDNDIFQIVGLPPIASDEIQGLAPNLTSNLVTSTVNLDLLDFYSSSDILGILTGGLAGQIPLFYQDDARISLATLALTADDTRVPSVPEPTLVFGLLAFGSVGGFLKGCQKS